MVTGCGVGVSATKHGKMHGEFAECDEIGANDFVVDDDDDEKSGDEEPKLPTVTEGFDAIKTLEQLGMEYNCSGLLKELQKLQENKINNKGKERCSKLDIRLFPLDISSAQCLHLQTQARNGINISQYMASGLSNSTYPRW